MVSRPRTTLLLAITLVLGIASRRMPLGVSLWDKSLGDALYAVAVYLVFALAVPSAPPSALALAAFAFSFAVELFQLTGIPATLGQEHGWLGWFLGTTFAWHDVACYAIGVLAIAALARRLAAGAPA
jgi:hypothetical protein